jgi:ABC-type bacteriocin/lantibiotic exporter with double-glycine peptidase domain
MVAFIIMAALEVVGVATIMPFMAVLGNPEIIHENRWLSATYEMMDLHANNSFLLFLGGVVLGTLVIRNAFSSLITWFSLRFVNTCNHRFSESLLRNYLYKPYTFFLKTNSAEMAKNILSEVSRVTDGLLIPFIQAAVSTVVLISILLLLAWVDIRLTVSIALMSLTIYMLIFALSKKILIRSSLAADLANKKL